MMDYMCSKDTIVVVGLVSALVHLLLTGTIMSGLLPVLSADTGIMIILLVNLLLTIYFMICMMPKEEKEKEKEEA
jgi:hypothetical protein